MAAIASPQLLTVGEQKLIPNATSFSLNPNQSSAMRLEINEHVPKYSINQSAVATNPNDGIHFGQSQIAHKIDHLATDVVDHQ